MVTAGSRESTAAQDVEGQDYDCHDQQEVDEATADVEAEAQKPKDAQQHENRPQHVLFLS
jgi:hypothetical protein